MDASRRAKNVVNTLSDPECSYPPPRCVGLRDGAVTSFGGWRLEARTDLASKIGIYRTCRLSGFPHSSDSPRLAICAFSLLLVDISIPFKRQEIRIVLEARELLN